MPVPAPVPAPGPFGGMILGPVVLGGLTTLVGNFLMNRQGQIKAQREFRAAEVKMATQVFDDVSVSADALCSCSRDVMWALVLRPDRDNEWKPEDNAAWKNYTEGLSSWNKSRSRNLALTGKYFGDEAAKRLKKVQGDLEDLEKKIDSNYFGREEGKSFMTSGNANHKKFLRTSDRLHKTDIVALTELMIDKLQKQEVGALTTTNV